MIARILSNFLKNSSHFSKQNDTQNDVTHTKKSNPPKCEQRAPDKTKSASSNEFPQNKNKNVCSNLTHPKKTFPQKTKIKAIDHGLYL